MSSVRCARCGRDRINSEYWPTPDAPYDAWLWVAGQDVCPHCQTADERHDAEQRIVAAVEREVERRRSAGVPPDPYEPPIVEHVMDIRAGAEGDAPEGGVESPPGHAREPVDHADRLRLRVAVTGAFLTGHPLTVRLDAYGDLQRKLGDRLRGPQWRSEGLDGEGGTYQSGGGFTHAVPLTIARRDGADLLPFISAALAGPPDQDSPGDRPAGGFELTPLALAIDVYDLGVGVLMAWFDVVAAPGADLRDTARAVKDLVKLRDGEQGRPPLAAALEQIARRTAGDYADAVVAVAPEEIRVQWLSRLTPEAPARPATDDPPAEQGRLLWLHPIHVVQGAASTTSAAEELAPTFCETMPIDDGLFVAGIGWSVIVVPTRRRAAAVPVRLTMLHWAYYALYMAIDRRLLVVLNQPRWAEHVRLKQLEVDADDVFADYLRVMDARARLDSALGALGGDELAIWETVARVQRFDPIVDGVERKLDVLQTLAQRRVDLASADRARRTGNILGGLTVLTVVTVTVGLIGAFFGAIDPGSGTKLGRAALVAAAVLIAACVYWLAFVRSDRPPRRPARKA